MSLSNCAGSSRCQAPHTNNKLSGQSIKLKIQTVPPSEKILKGSQLCHTPVWPRKCNQQLVTRKGGNANARMAATKNPVSHRAGNPTSQRVDMNPRPSETI